ncbi:MAG: PDZ domain-containing protein [Clostridiales bacterium]|jgi:carboxyl-terminal processing protease|nr:PDZ domain-containing protein [Clostridiales bacterium]
MNRKISLGLALTLIIASITATFAITMTAAQKIYNGLISNLSSRAETYATIENINTLVRANYYDYKSIEDAKINLSISKGYINGLGNPNCRFLTASEYIDYKRKLEGNATGVGITAAWDNGNKSLAVTDVAPGSSASSKGVLKGDIIKKIDGKKITSSNYEELFKMLEGDNLTTVDITCDRKNETKEFKVTIGYSLVSVSGKNIDGIGYVRISAFYGNTQSQLKNTLNSLKNEGVKGIIFDLRGTSDGSVEYAAAAVDCITPVCSNPDELLVTLVGRNNNIIYQHASASNDLNLPMMILVNGKTSGPSELFACDLRDFEKAKLIGTTTSGVGTAQRALTLEDGSAVILTVAKIMPYKSDSFDDTGLLPDFEVKLAPEDENRIGLISDEKDLQLQKAISELAA